MASGAAEIEVNITHNLDDVGRSATIARREVRKLAKQARHAVRALAQLDEQLAELGIGLEIQPQSEEDTGV